MSTVYITYFIFKLLPVSERFYKLFPITDMAVKRVFNVKLKKPFNYFTHITRP